MEYQNLANQYATQFGLDPRMFSAQINQESRWNPRAVSPVGAQGLGQVMPDTASQPGFGIAPLADPWDPDANLRFSAEYMSKMVNRYDGDVNRALAAYNWGVGNADRWDGNLSSLPQETRDYITKINGGMVPDQAALSGAPVPQVSTQALPPQVSSDGAGPQFSTRGIPEEAVAMLNSDPQVVAEGGMPPPQAPTNRRDRRAAEPTSSAGEFWNGVLSSVTPEGDPNQGTRGRAAELEASRDPANAPIEDIIRRAETGILSAEASQPSEPSAPAGMTQEEADAFYANSPVLSDVQATQERWNPVPSRDQNRPTATQQGALDQSNQEQDPQYAERGSLQDILGINAEGGGMIPRAMGWDQYTQDQRDNRWLAIGQGLLSGDDWASGMGNVAGNLLGINQQEAAQAQQQAAQSGAGSYNRPFNVVGRDPESGQEVVRSGTLIGGIPHITDENGMLVPAETVMRDVRIGGRSESQDVTMGAGGIPNASYVTESGIPVFQFQREGEQKNYGYAIRAIGAYKDLDGIMQSMPQEQITSLRTGLERWASSNANASVTGAVLNDIIGNSGLSGAMAPTMRAYLQAILRADTGAAYTGTEIGDYASAFLPAPGDDPQDIEQKRRLMERELLRFVGTTGSAAPYLGGVLDGKYDLPGGYWQDSAPSAPAQGGNDNIDSILQGYGL